MATDTDMPLSSAFLFRGEAMTFTKWLMQQCDRHDWIADLACDARDDKTWPKSATKYKDINAHLRNQQACNEALLAFHEAWIEWSGKLPFECPGARCDEQSCEEEGCQITWFTLHGYEPYLKDVTSERAKMSASLRFSVLQRDEFVCCLCGYGKADGRKIEVDHKIPVAKGGKTELDNLWTLCFECNRGKGARVMQ